MATLIKTTGEIINVEPENGTDFQLEELYKMLGCELIEIVRAEQKGMIMIIDETGATEYGLKPFNYEASIRSLYCQHLRGDVLLCKSSQLK